FRYDDASMAELRKKAAWVLRTDLLNKLNSPLELSVSEDLQQLRSKLQSALNGQEDSTVAGEVRSLQPSQLLVSSAFVTQRFDADAMYRVDVSPSAFPPVPL